MVLKPNHYGIVSLSKYLGTNILKEKVLKITLADGTGLIACAKSVYIKIAPKCIFKNLQLKCTYFSDFLHVN